MEINEQVEDSYLKELITACLKTKNHEKIAFVGYLLISNKVGEIGIKLGFKPLKIKLGNLGEYMEMVNEIVKNNLKLEIFKFIDLRKLKKIEVQLSEIQKRNDETPLRLVKEIFSTYFELKKINVPNLYKSIKKDEFKMNPGVKLFSRFSKNQGRDQDDDFKQIILQKLNERQLTIREEFNKKGIKKSLLKEAVQVKNFKDTIDNKDKKRVEVQGLLKDNLNYQKSLDDIIGIFVLGIILLFFIVGVVITFEAIIYPYLIGSLYVLFLLTFGLGFVLLMLYLYYFKK